MPYNTRAHLKLMTPVNVADEKAKFFADNSYAPQLQYRWNSPDDELVREWLSINPDLLPLVNALVRQDPAELEAVGRAFFEVDFRPDDIAFAESIVKGEPQRIHGTAEDVARVMADQLRQLDLDYEVMLDDRQGFNVRPDHVANIVRISKALHIQFQPPEEIVRHELVHIIRAVNGAHNDIQPQPGYLPDDEGLACLVEDGFMERHSGSLFQHAAEYLAAYVSRTASLREVYDFLRSRGFDADSAWGRAVRHKFGLRDTARPGSLLRSAMYFYHEQLLDELTHDELLRLFVGKIPRTALPDYPAYAGRVPREKLEAFLTQRTAIKS